MFKRKNWFLLLSCFVWALVFLGPYLRNMDETGEMGKTRMIGDWLFLVVFFIVFLINIYILVPRFLLVTLILCLQDIRRVQEEQQ